MTTDRCTHSFPDPYPQPLSQIGDCRHCGITYQEAKAAMTTPADELHAAARTLRSLLADPHLTPGPWLSMDRGDRLLWDGEGAEDQQPVYVVDEPMSNGANADYIAVLHPDVAHGLADWLETEAQTWAGDEIHYRCSPGTCTLDAALAVARQINRSQT